jgi:hypothetical protein
MEFFAHGCGSTLIKIPGGGLSGCRSSTPGIASEAQLEKAGHRLRYAAMTTRIGPSVRTVLVIAAVVLALALMPASAAPRQDKRHTKAATAVQPQIACTVVGCVPVPRGHPEMGYTPGGTPTGFDVAVCPNYTLYGYRR